MLKLEQDNIDPIICVYYCQWLTYQVLMTNTYEALKLNCIIINMKYSKK